MKHIAYGNIAQQNEEKEVIIDSLKKMNCPVFIESDIDNRREKWTEFIDILQEGDTAIIYSFSNTFVNYHDMIFFLKYCFTQDIRIVSLADKLDTQDILFPETHTKDVLLLVCKMFLQKKKSIDNLEADYSQSKSEEKLKRYMLVINMYSSGYSIKDIMTKTGYRGKSNIYRILKMYDVDVYYPQKIRKTTLFPKPLNKNQRWN